MAAPGNSLGLPFSCLLVPTVDAGSYTIEESSNVEADSKRSLEDIITEVNDSLVKASPLPSTMLMVGLCTMATAHAFIWRRNRDMDELNQAISGFRQSKSLEDPTWEAMISWPNLMAHLLIERFQEEQNLADLNEAITFYDHGFNALMRATDDKAMFANQASHALMLSFQYLRHNRLLSEGIRLNAMARSVKVSDSDLEAECLLGGGTLALFAFTQWGKVEDIESSIEMLRSAIQKGLKNPENRARAKEHLLLAQAKLALRNDDKLTLHKLSRDYIPSSDSVSTPATAFSVADKYYTLWEVSTDKTDDFSREKLTQARDGLLKTFEMDNNGARTEIFHGLNLVLAGNVSHAWEITFRGLNMPSKLEDPTHYWMKCWKTPRTLIDVKFQSARLMGRYLYKHGKRLEAWNILKDAVDMITLACPPHFAIEDKSPLLANLNTLSVDACSVGLTLGLQKEALEILERGRGLLHNDFQGSSPDGLIRLQKDHPEIYAKFERLRSRRVNYPQGSTERQAGTPSGTKEGQEDLETIVAEIRQLPGFQNFLQPVNFEQMQSLANPYPIVVLVGSEIRQFAVIVEHNNVRTIDIQESVEPAHYLPASVLRSISTKAMTAVGDASVDPAYRNKFLLDLLIRLWKGVARPINDALGFTDVPWPPSIENILDNSWGKYVRWIRTGFFNRLPIQMAMGGDDPEVLTPFVMRASHSFIPTFKALGQARLRRSQIKSFEGKPGLIVSMSRPPARGIKKLLPGSNKTTTRSMKETRLVGRNPWIANAKEEIEDIRKNTSTIKWTVADRPSPTEVQRLAEDHAFFHFICHGVSNPRDPLKSHLKLWQQGDESQGIKDRVENLRVGDLTTWTSNRASIAFLSACSTADTKAETAFEENLDICNVLHIAGIPDVVGSSWPIPNATAQSMSTFFWDMINRSYTPENSEYIVARCLNQTLLMAAFQNKMDLIYWAGFLHIG